ncbi:hypothetical protein SJS84_06510 [Aeromonas caviae]|uniref:hypothetical protein n=1 Tax=Aeromonas caviae TaxID=648 RepID=UPI0029DB038D|nr:hypothetical protein [Aeromonas caviae]MDX7790353.1 hypothetical protein [Aeromonas caviae]
MSEVFKIGDEVSYRNRNGVSVPAMRIEFIDGDAVTCSYLERRPKDQAGQQSLAMMAGFSPYSIKTIVLNAASLEKVG